MINISKNNIYGVQCSSVKIGDNESYFSKNKIPFYEFKFTDLEFVTHIRLDLFEKIHEINDVYCMSNLLEFNDICLILINSKWENDEYFNHNEIVNHIKKGIKRHGNEWEI